MAPHHTPPRRPLIAGILIALVAIAIAAALALRFSNRDSIVLSDTGLYVEGVAGSWQRVNPLYASLNEVDQDLSALVFSGLTRIGPDGSVHADLAEFPQISGDGKTYTFRLRKGLTWHDGEPVTSRDFAFTIARLTDPNFAGDAALREAWLGVKVETPDDLTVVLTLNQQASAPFLARNTTVGILPEHLLAAVSAAGMFDASFNSKPVGTGPYRIESLDSRQAVLTANPDYHFGQPLIGELRLRFFSDYPSAIRALASGGVQGLMVRDRLTEAQLTEIQEIKGVKIESPGRAAYLVLYLNNDQTEFFADERVRRAISRAIDRQAIVDRVFGGVGTPSSSAVAPGTWAYDQRYDHPTANITEARDLLRQAGWVAHPTTGILTREGTEFRFTIRTDTDPQRLAVASEIARQLDAIGIKATVASTTFSVLRRDFLQERKYDAAVAVWDQGPDPDPYFGWHSSQMGAAGLNIANYASVIADGLIEQGRLRNDREIRLDAYHQFQDVWDESTPSPVLLYERYLFVHPDSLDVGDQGVLFSAAQRFTMVHRWRQ